VLCDLLEGIKQGRPVNNIRGLAFLKDNIPIVNQALPLLDLDELPLPDRRFLDLPLYKGESTPGLPGRKTAVIYTSRGCPYACSFCASKIVHRQRIRFRSMKKIFEEIEDIVALGFNHLTVEDDVFTLDSRRVREFCSYLIKKHPQVSWDCDSRVDALNEELLAIMKESQYKKIAMGVESGSPRILKLINKNIDIHQVKAAFQLTKKMGIATQAFFMLGSPDETLEDIKMTEKLIFEIDPDFLFLSIFVPYPGTALYNDMLKAGLLAEGKWDSFIFFGQTVPWRTHHFSNQDLVRIRKGISRRFYFRLSYMYKKLSAVRGKEDLRYLIRGGIVAFRTILPSENKFTKSRELIAK